MRAAVSAVVKHARTEISSADNVRLHSQRMRNERKHRHVCKHERAGSESQSGVRSLSGDPEIRLYEPLESQVSGGAVRAAVITHVPSDVPPMSTVIIALSTRFPTNRLWRRVAK